jgi:hypothetical protein
MLGPGFATLSAASVLADNADGGESKKAGPIGLVVILLLVIACYFLFRSMSRHLRKVRQEFPDGDGPPAADRPADDTGPTAEPRASEPPPGRSANGAQKPESG